MFILPSVLFSGLAIQFLSVTSFEFVVTSDPDSFSRCFVDNFTAGEDPYILPSMLFIRCYIPYSGKAMLDVVPRNRTHCAAIEGSIAAFCRRGQFGDRKFLGTVAKLAMRQPFVLFKGLTFQKLCLPGAFRPGDHHNKMLRPG
ncbi:hypothetical protein, partial [Escherichia coli]|uniref:hypothetical protein n=4 Tax=Enterobacteriaceae TaxID=543 RepID=UPI001BDB72AE|nr:hypothetical protein [Providencia rettgeri]